MTKNALIKIFTSPGPNQTHQHPHHTSTKKTKSCSFFWFAATAFKNLQNPFASRD